MQFVQASHLTINTTTDQDGHKQVTNNGIEKPELIFSDKFLNVCTETHAKHAVRFTGSVDISHVAKCPSVDFSLRKAEIVRNVRFICELNVKQTPYLRATIE